MFLPLILINAIQNVISTPTPILVQPRHVHLALGEVKGTFSVSWSTINKTEQSIVIVYNKGKELGFKGESFLFVDGGEKKASQWIHKVVVSGLDGDTSYRYIVGSYVGWSDVFTMQTLPTGKYIMMETSNKVSVKHVGSNWSPHLAMFGDMGNENAVSLPLIQREVDAGHFDAVIHVGDMAYDMAELDGLRGDIFMEKIEPIASQVPYMTCPGNHEWHYNFTNYKARFNMPFDQRNNMFFSYDIGPVHFVSVSTEFYYFLNYGYMQVGIRICIVKLYPHFMMTSGQEPV